MNLTNITETTTNYPVRNLKWNPLDNIIVGQVKCPYGKPTLHDGYITVQWKANGKPTNFFRGYNDLILSL